MIGPTRLTLWRGDADMGVRIVVAHPSLLQPKKGGEDWDLAWNIVLNWRPSSLIRRTRGRRGCPRVDERERLIWRARELGRQLAMGYCYSWQRENAMIQTPYTRTASTVKTMHVYLLFINTLH